MDEHYFVGLDVNSRPPYYSAIAIDANGNYLLAINGNWEEIIETFRPYENILISINTPVRPNIGLLTQSKRKKHKPGKWPDVRLIEYMLEEYGAPIYHTPKKKGNLLAAQQYGFQLIERIKIEGFHAYGIEQSRCFCEVPAETAFWSIERKHLFDGQNFIGQIQRQLLLLELGINLPDPMAFFEEITRYKLLTGNAPLEMILETSILNAWINAFTAKRIKQNPSQVSTLGDPQEGLIYLPYKLPGWEDIDPTIQARLL